MSHPDFILDKRVLERNVAKGILTREEFEKALAKPPTAEDTAGACAPVAPGEAGEEEWATPTPSRRSTSPRSCSR